MSNLFLPHFQEPQHDSDVPSGELLPSDRYAQALDHIVIACVDLVFTCEGKICLACRRRLPRLGWWLIGGRMFKGEDPIATAQRKASQEANVHDLMPDRFRFLGVYSTVFAQRSQEPQNHGVHTLNVTYQVELLPEEVNTLQLDPDEYSHWQWMSTAEAEMQLNETNVMDGVLQLVLGTIRGL